MSSTIATATTTAVNSILRMLGKRNTISAPELRQLLVPSRSFCAQLLTAGALATTGDVICQKVVERREQLDARRTSRFALTTMLIIVPIQFRWFRFLERKFPTTSRQPFDRLKTALKRVALDQSCMAPTLTAAFLFSLNLMESSFSLTAAQQKFKRIYPEVIINNYKFWPFVQLVNMTVVPLHFRVVFLQFFAIFWNIYVSYRANSED